MTTTHVALFRGINVGGKTVLPMSELVAALESLGARNVRTYIQSGNAVFRHDGSDGPHLSERIGAEIEKRRGFAPRVLLLAPGDIERTVAENPFPEAEADPKSLHVAFLASTPKAPDLKALDRLKAQSERYHLSPAAFYLHAPDGVGRSKLAASAEKLLGVPMTDRNWRTVLKILELTR